MSTGGTSTTTDFNAFRRQYYKARDAFQAHASGGSTQVRYKSEKGGPLEHELNLPDEEAAIRLAVVMRPFLTPTSPLFIADVLDELDGGPVSIGEETMDRLISDYETARTSVSKIIYNDEELTPDKIYELVSKGGFFEDDDEAVRLMEQLQKGPLQPMVWFQFLGYVERCFKVVHNTWLAMRDAGPLPRPDHLPPALREAEYRCIYCRATDASFESEEHHVPEGLGNYFEVLPRGYVCDNCNHGVLSGLDEAILKFGPLVLLRVWAVPYSKDGTLPKGEVKEARIKKVAPRQIDIERKKEAQPVTGDTVELGPSIKLDLTITDDSGAMPKTIGRALFKMALGILAYREGHDTVLNPFYDPAREFVVDGSDWDGSLIVLANARPHGGITFSFHGHPPRWVAADLFGLRFVFCLRENDQLDSSEVYERRGGIYCPAVAASFRMVDGVDWANI